jgi:hypothetical protein
VVATKIGGSRGISRHLDEDRRVSKCLNEYREDLAISARSAKSSKGRNIDRTCAILIGCTCGGRWTSSRVIVVSSRPLTGIAPSIESPASPSTPVMDAEERIAWLEREILVLRSANEYSESFKLEPEPVVESTSAPTPTMTFATPIVPIVPSLTSIICTTPIAPISNSLPSSLPIPYFANSLSQSISSPSTSVSPCPNLSDKIAHDETISPLISSGLSLISDDLFPKSPPR